MRFFMFRAATAELLMFGRGPRNIFRSEVVFDAKI